MKTLKYFAAALAIAGASFGVGHVSTSASSTQVPSVYKEVNARFGGNCNTPISSGSGGSLINAAAFLGVSGASLDTVQVRVTVRTSSGNGHIQVSRSGGSFGSVSYLNYHQAFTPRGVATFEVDPNAFGHFRLRASTGGVKACVDILGYRTWAPS